MKRGAECVVTEKAPNRHCEERSDEAIRTGEVLTVLRVN